MTETTELTNEDRIFLNLVKDAFLANPFSEKRKNLDKELAQSSGESKEQIIEKLVFKVQQKLKEFKSRGIKSILNIHKKDRELFEIFILFNFFYLYRKEIDTHILEQINQDEKILKISFAQQAKEDLENWGFSSKEIQSCFEEAFQLRRAFFFIKTNIIGKSPVMKQLRRDLWDNIFTHDLYIYRKYLKNRMEDFSTLILGKTGTGKGAAAAAIGRSGYIPFDMKKLRFEESFTSSFFPINLSQFPATLIESELFGHRKGSFTGAVDNYDGVFKRCSPHGSIFLDEIGDVSLPVQVKLLQVIQDRFFYPVGSYKTERFYGRVVAATNMDINRLREEGHFRDDFFYRLCSDVIKVPTLYERIQSDKEELTDLISFLIKRILGKESLELLEMVLDVIDKRLGSSYPWPGNVRELEQCIRSVFIKKDYPGNFKSAKQSFENQIFENFKNGTISAQDLVNGYCKILYNRHNTFEEVAKRTCLDRRTVNKYIKESEKIICQQ
jgi:DNA-binding NtrC family response regulator